MTWGDGKVKLDYNPTVDNPNPSLLDRFGRIKTMDIRKMTGPTESTPIHKYEYAYDANGNRTYARIEQAGHPNDRSYIYEYDKLNRLVDAGWGTINVVNDQATYDPDAVRTTTAWGLDLLGNWSGGVTELRDTNGDAAGGVEHLRTRSHVVNAANEIITTSEQIGALPAIERPFAYDVVGNLIFDGEKFYKYDAWNRIVAVYENDDDDQLVVDVNGYLSGTPGSLIAVYDYDALGRRIAKTLGTATSPTDYFYYDGHRVIEHHTDDGSGMALNKQYVYGLNFIDEPVAYYDADPVTGLPVNTPHFILQDANYDVVGITDDQAGLVQQMTLDPYGNYLYIEDGNGAIYGTEDADISALLIPLGRNGLWYDPETGLYYNRIRYYGPKFGRFMQGDPNGTGLVCSCGLKQNARPIGGRLVVSATEQYVNGLNLYNYLESSPSLSTDPSGLAVVTGPTAGIISWIDSFTVDTNVLFSVMDASQKAGAKNTYKSYYKLNVALDQLSISANNRPPTSFTAASWTAFVDAKDYRGWMSIVPSIDCDASGRVNSGSVKKLANHGWTPVQNSEDSPVLTYMEGEGKSNVIKTRSTQGCMKFLASHEFMIGGIGQTVATMLAGVGPPWGWHEIEYELCCNGTKAISYGGSFFPSHAGYVAGVEKRSRIQSGLAAFMYAGFKVRGAGGPF